MGVGWPCSIRVVTSVLADWGSWFAGCLGVCCGESRGEDVGGQNEEGDWIGEGGCLCEQSGINGQHEPILEFYPGRLYIPLWCGCGFGGSGNI